MKFDNCIMPASATGVPATKGASCNTPLGKYGLNNMIIAGRGFSATVAYDKRNFYFFSDCSGMANYAYNSAPSGGCTFPFTGIQAMAYDSKIDDGLPNTGSVLGRQTMFIASMGVSALVTSYTTTSAAPDTILMQMILPNQP